MNEIKNQAKQTPIEIALGIVEDGKTTARNLYEFLEMDETHYSRWVKSNIVDNPFAIENEDYEVLAIRGEKPKGGRPTQDFKLSANFAKKLSMQGKTEKAEQARDYFIKVEDKLKEAVQKELEKKESGGATMRLYKNNRWYILTIGDEIYSLKPDEAAMIVKAQSAMVMNGVTQVIDVIKTMVAGLGRDRHLEFVSEFTMGNGNTALEDKACGNAGG